MKGKEGLPSNVQAEEERRQGRLASGPAGAAGMRATDWDEQHEHWQRGQDTDSEEERIQEMLESSTSTDSDDWVDEQDTDSEEERIQEMLELRTAISLGGPWRSWRRLSGRRLSAKRGRQLRQGKAAATQGSGAGGSSSGGQPAPAASRRRMVDKPASSTPPATPASDASIPGSPARRIRGASGSSRAARHLRKRRWHGECQ